MEDLNKLISLNCCICGNDQFSILDDDIEDMLNAPDETKVKCSDCGRITTKEQIIEENSRKIDANVEDLKKEIMGQLHNDIRKMFR